MTRSFLRDGDLTQKELLNIFDRIGNLKPRMEDEENLEVLENKIVVLLFEKPSTRTRNSFEAAVLRLGGKSVYNASSNMQLKRGEPIKDTARILGSYYDALIARVFAQDTVDQLAEHSGIPVINGLSDLNHPTQAVCDLYTVLEVKGRLKGLTMAYIGDGDNVCHSLLMACSNVGMNVNAACPEGYMPSPDIVAEAEKLAAASFSRVMVVSDPRQAASGADVLYTDVWVSMGEEEEKEKRLKDFEGYQINDALLELADKDAVVMHCLPAHRGLEITDDVIEGPRSVVWRQGANKMYAAAGILDFFLNR
ncbi:MAG: ornithine carbamoyltransferase [Actinomycetota bacterium]|nr:ornithine carbamoyltransferase [Actinomycetota bacterium]